MMVLKIPRAINSESATSMQAEVRLGRVVRYRLQVGHQYFRQRFSGPQQKRGQPMGGLC